MTTKRDVLMARARMLARAPWLAALACALEPEPEPGLNTTATDGLRLYYDPIFFAGLSRDEQIALIAHETLHVGLLHCDPRRRGDREHGQWNAAGDYVINAMLIAAGMHLPSGALLDKKYDGMTTEQIYDDLPPSRKTACCRDGYITDTQRRQIKQTMTQTAHAAKRAGVGGAYWDRLLDEQATPRINWRDILRAELRLSMTGLDDFSWRRPSRHGIATGLYLPGRCALGARQAVIAIDTSGSMSETDCAEAVAIVRDCARETLTQITVIVADSTIRDEQHLADGQDWRPSSIKGGGGTDFGPAVRRAQELGAELMIYVSDMQAPMPQRGLLKIVWLTHAEAIPPGETVIKLEEKSEK